MFYQFYLVIEEAERWAYGDEMKRQAEAFLRFAIDRVGETKIAALIELRPVSPAPVTGS